MPDPTPAGYTRDEIILDDLPQSVQETIDARDRALAELRGGAAGLEFIVSDLQRWLPGQTVRVAFLDGDSQLHEDIEDAVGTITQACNLKLDFRDPTTGTFRTWSENDTEYAAEIRVSFDMRGYFSLVGTDSVNQAIGGPGDPVGGRPGQRSLNLGGFAVQRPSTWQGTTRHEFLHALSFHHSHQNMRGPCEQDFRWDDDPGYQPTQDSRGVFVADAQGRRPGIYTYLSGQPNQWSRDKVDHNLRTDVHDPNTVAGPFDRESVMLYRFPELFYRNPSSTCMPAGDGIEISAGDRRGLNLLYPRTAAEVQERVAERTRTANALNESRVAAHAGARDGLESPPSPAEVYVRETRAAAARALGM